MNLNWLESHGFLSPAGVILMMKMWTWTRRAVRRSLPALKHVAAAVSGYVIGKTVYLHFRFFASKQETTEAANAVVFIALVYFIGKAMMEGMPKTSEPPAA